MAGVRDPALLGSLALFQGLQPDQLAAINDLLHRRTFSTGTDIIIAEEPGEVAYIILSGTVKIHTEQADGSSVILSVLGPGEVVGEMSLVENIGRSATVVTLEETTLLWMTRESFDTCLHRMPELSFNLIRILSRRLRLAGAQIRALATLDVFGRVARQLVAFSQEYGHPTADGGILIPLRLTQGDLAGIVGASRVRVNRVLAVYRHQNYISIDQNNRIAVLNTAALLQRCQ